MGDIADWILEGGLCEGCGEYLGEGGGFARRCYACGGDERETSFRQMEKQARHLCHADNCKTEVPRKLLMCGRHWKMVSKETQRLVWKRFRPDLFKKQQPTREWIKAASTAKAEVRAAERAQPKPAGEGV